MPIFEFVCEDCEKQMELLVGRNEIPSCSHCGSQQLEKLISVSAGRVGGPSLPLASACPPPEAGPCSPGCCRLP